MRNHEVGTLQSQFSYTRWSVSLSWLSVFLEGFLALLLISFSTLVVSRSADYSLRIATVVTFLAAGVAISRVIWKVRYRRVMSCVYAVEENGVWLQHLPGQHWVAWDEIEVGEYVPLVPAYRLLGSNKDLPIVLFVEKGWRRTGVNARNALAAERIRAGLGRKLHTRWFPLI